MIEITPPEAQPPRACKHGQSYTQEYRIWRGLVNRCTRPTDPAWDNYGGRGIKVCAEWLTDFDAFLSDMGRKPSAGHEIDRRDNELGYDRHNCRWVSRKVNSRNRRSSRMIVFRGLTMCLAEACELAGISYAAVQKRLSAPLNWSLEKALHTPTRPKAKKGCGFKPKPQSNKTGYPGVKKRRSAYKARILVSGKRLESQQFATPEEAYSWYLTHKKLQSARKQSDSAVREAS
jgi:hypothetical protein